MMSSILLNPQLIIYSMALGPVALVVRIFSCFLCGIAAGLLVRFFYRDKNFFTFTGFANPKSHHTDPNLFVRFLKNLGRNVKTTGLYFLIGIVLSAVFQRYVPGEAMTTLFGGNEAFGVLTAATIGVPLYACGGGTIPLLNLRKARPEKFCACFRNYFLFSSAISVLLRPLFSPARKSSEFLTSTII